MKKEIKYVVHTISSRTDINGNRYHSAAVYRCSDGRCVTVRNVGGESNAYHLVRQMLKLQGIESWHPAVLGIQSDESIRRYNEIVRSWDYLRGGAEELLQLFNEVNKNDGEE